MIEEWKDVPGFGDNYQASSLGRVRAKERVVYKYNWRADGIIKHRYKQRVLSQNIADKWGHLSVHLGVDGRKFTVAVHRLVLFAFHGFPIDGQEACHNNGLAWCNRPSNLRWDTHAANNRDRVNHGTYAVGEKHPMAKIPEGIAKDIKYGSLTAIESARKHGVRYQHAWAIKTGRSWSHL
jgi:hypothetical protein